MRKFTAKVAQANPEVSEEIFETIIPLLSDAQQRVRLFVLDNLDTYDDLRVLDFYLQALADKEQQVRYIAFRKLITYEDLRIAEALLKLLEAGNETEYLQADILNYLHQVGHEQTYDLALKFLSHKKKLC